MTAALAALLLLADLAVSPAGFQGAIPQLVVLAALPIPPIPLPPLPHGLPPNRLDVRQDGAAGDYVTIAF